MRHTCKGDSHLESKRAIFSVYGSMERVDNT
jgi:hypothetical protein